MRKARRRPYQHSSSTGVPCAGLVACVYASRDRTASATSRKRRMSGRHGACGLRERAGTKAGRGTPEVGHGCGPYGGWWRRRLTECLLLGCERCAGELPPTPIRQSSDSWSEPACEALEMECEGGGEAEVGHGGISKKIGRLLSNSHAPRPAALQAQAGGADVHQTLQRRRLEAHAVRFRAQQIHRRCGVDPERLRHVAPVGVRNERSRSLHG